MSRLELNTPNKAQIVVEGLYKELERRIEASPPGLCPVGISNAFLRLCQIQTCGKCAPCRIGLVQLGNLLTDVLDGKATMETLSLLENTALSVMQSADCAIGYEAAASVYRGLNGFRSDYEEHIKEGRCTCTYSLPVPCVALCPANVDIPGYVALVGEGRYEDAVRLIRKDNPFPSTCGYICEHPCEARCRRNMVDDAINIRGLKRVASDFAGVVPPPKPAESTGKKVAVVGGGPGGLSAAYYLQLMGHEVTVFEMLPELGGMLRYGIPNYRLPNEKMESDIKTILDTGVKVVLNTKIGKEIHIDKLRDEYDAVLVSIGASTDKKLGMENEKANGVYSAVEFLRDIDLNGAKDLSGKNVVVIGGGNVSMDAVRSAIRMGAGSVKIVYRRRVSDMTALSHEIDGAVAEGVELLTLKAPKSINVDENGAVKSITVTPQMIGSIKDGRAAVKANGEPDIELACDVLIVAIGQDVEYHHFAEAGLPINKGVLSTENDASFINLPGVFAGGDCATGPATVIKAIAAAKVVAANIDEYLGFRHEISSGVEIPEPRLADRTPCGRVNLPEREAVIRSKDFKEVELCMTEVEAKQEANRCLRCDHFGFGIFKGGREIQW